MSASSPFNWQIKDLQRQIDELRVTVDKTTKQAEAAAERLEQKEQELEAEALAKSMVAKWIQIGLGALVIVGTLWSSRWLAALDQVKAFFGAFR